VRICELCKKPIAEKYHRQHVHYRDGTDPALSKIIPVLKRNLLPENHPRPWLGKKLSEETRKKMSEAHKHRHWDENVKRKISEVKKAFYKLHPEAKLWGNKNPRWRGGRAYEPYDWKFHMIKKIRLRLDNYTCQLCGRTQDLVVHHIDQNKHNSSLGNLITLCRSCHSKIHSKEGDVYA
jgi:5-methylcytosine-specific restriction endonuclease McrA